MDRKIERSTSVFLIQRFVCCNCCIDWSGCMALELKYLERENHCPGSNPLRGFQTAKEATLSHKIWEIWEGDRQRYQLHLRNWRKKDMLQRITFAFYRCNGCKTWHLFECSMAVGDPYICMIFFWPHIYIHARLLMIHQAWTQWHSFPTFSPSKIWYLGNVFGKRINTEKAGGGCIMGQFCQQLIPAGNW